MFWPRSITTRTMFMVGSLMLLSYIISVVLIIMFLKQPVAQSTVTYLTRQVVAIHQGLSHMTPTQQKQYLNVLASRKQIKIQSAEPPNTPPGNLVRSKASTYVNRLLGINTEIRSQKINNYHIAWVKLNIVKPHVWIGVWTSPGKARFGLNFIIQLIVIIILSGVAVAFTTIRLVRPVKKLADAAIELGQGERPAPLPENGPREIQQLCKAFNKMSLDIHKLAEDRNLLLAGISHDLRTPLARMRLAIEIMGNKVDADLRAGILRDMEDIDNIVGQFLAYARDGSEEAVKKTDITKLVNSLANTYQHKNEQQKPLTVDISDNIPLIDLRPVSIRRMLINLVDNAFEYGKAPVEIAVSCDTSQITICVKDHGPGIPEPDIQALLKPFSRKSKSRTNAQHAGLGLAIVQRIVKMHHATLKISNRASGGLKICIQIPVDPE